MTRLEPDWLTGLVNILLAPKTDRHNAFGPISSLK